MYKIGDRVIEKSSGIGGMVIDVIYDILIVHFDDGSRALIATDKVTFLCHS